MFFPIKIKHITLNKTGKDRILDGANIAVVILLVVKVGDAGDSW